MKPKAIFIDRDGVINKDPGGWTKYGYVTRWEEFGFLPGALEALGILKREGIGTIVISNQAGVNKGYFSKDDLQKVNRKMLKEVESSGGNIKEAYYCVHTEEDGCDCRKPKTGLFKKAIEKYKIDATDTYFIGDGERDIEAGRRLGIKTIFVLSGKTSRGAMKKWDIKADYIFDDLLKAVKWIVRKDSE